MNQSNDLQSPIDSTLATTSSLSSFMRRHIPTLYAHPEHENGDTGGEDETQWAASTIHRPSPYGSSPGLTTTVTSKPRMKQRSPTSFTASPTIRMHSSNNMPSSSSRYPDMYSQFVKRYRSRPGTFYDSQDGPESSVLHRAPGQFLDDESDEDRPGSSHGLDARERHSSPAVENDILEPKTVQERERLEWQSMLASVLDGDVLRTEKSRIQVALMNSPESRNSRHLDIWLGIRAKLRGRQVEDERRNLEERKLHLVDRVIGEIMHFRVVDSPGSPSALHQVNVVLHHLDKIHSFYPHLKAFYVDKPTAAESSFQTQCDTLITWSNVLSSLRQQINLLRKWTGSETLDVTAHSTSTEHGMPCSVQSHLDSLLYVSFRWFILRRTCS